MITPNVFQLFRGGRPLRSYRTALRDIIRQEPAIRLLPGLLDLPLVPNDTSNIIQLFARSPRVGISGAIGSGRSLLLRQVAAEWAGSERADRVLYLSLTHADTPNLSPRAVLAAAIHGTGLSAPLSDGRNVADNRTWLLLFDDWEDLPPQRQQVWRTFIERLPHTWVAARVAITLPAGQTWPDMPLIELGEPTDLLLRRWVAHLLPNYDHEPILATLGPDQPLATLRSSVREIALLAMTFPVYGLPVSRAQLYENAAALAGPVLSAAEREAGGELGLDPHTSSIIGAPSWRDYSLAREAAVSGDLASLSDLAPHRRADTLFAAATLSADPTPIYELLWNAGHPTQIDLYILGASLREQPAVSSVWCLRLLELLDEGGSRPDLAALRWHLGPALPRLLAAAAQLSPERVVALLQGGALQPGALALVRLIDYPDAPSILRWAAADVVSARMLDPALLLAETVASADPTTKAICGYVLATGSAQSRAVLAHAEAQPWLASLSSLTLDPARRTAAARSILADAEVSDTLRLAALTLIASFEPGPRRDLLGRACADPNPSLRAAGLAALDGLADSERLLVISRVLATPALDSAALHDALDRLTSMVQGEAIALLARCVLSAALPLDGRLRALEAISQRGAGPLLLTRMIRLVDLHPAVRTAVTAWLGRLRVVGAVPELRDLALDPQCPPPLRGAAVTALGQIGRLPEGREAALAPLLRLLVAPNADSLLLSATITAIGSTTSAAAIPLLESLIERGAVDSIRAAWRLIVPAAANQRPDHWVEAGLPAAELLALQSLLAEGETLADQPSSLDELAERQAESLRAAAADALASLAAADSNLRDEVARILHRALRERASTPLIRRMLAALARVRPDGGLSDLGRLLADTTLDTTVRWLAAEQLGDRPAAAPTLVRYLQPGAVETFIAVKLAELLGRTGAPEALPTLGAIANTPTADIQLREAALGGLGGLADPALEPVLLRTITDAAQPLSLRVVAAGSLRGALDPATRQALRDLLRNERPFAPLAAALLRVLGRAADRESMALMLHYAQSELPGEALAAIEALAHVGDSTITPVLVRLNQSPAAAAEVRLAAAGALLILGGPEYMPLLQSATSSGTLPLQIQAFDLIHAANPASPQLKAPLNDRSAPLLLRLRAVELVAAQSPLAPQLQAVLADDGESTQLRVAAALALGRSGSPTAIMPLVALAVHPATAPLLRRRAIDGLARLAASPEGRAAQAALGLIAADMSQPAERWCWATHALTADTEA